MKFLSLFCLGMGIELILIYMKIPAEITIIATAFIIFGILCLLDELKKR